MKLNIFNLYNNLVYQYGYKTAYGKSAKVTVLDTTVEVVDGNRKITHDKETGNKVEASIYDGDKRTTIVYNEEGIAYLERTFQGEELISEKSLLEELNLNKEKPSENLIIKEIEQMENSVLVKEKNILQQKPEENIFLSEKTSVKGSERKFKIQSGEKVILDAVKKFNERELLTYYQDSLVEVTINYHNNSTNIESYLIKTVVPIYEEKEIKKANKGKPAEIEKIQTGTKIEEEKVCYNERGNLYFVNNPTGTIERIFNEDHSLHKQYIILDKDGTKEVVGKVITATKDIKVINNSTLSNDTIVSINRDLDEMDIKFNNKKIVLLNAEIIADNIIIVEETYIITGELVLDCRKYSIVENGAAYDIEEKYKKGVLFSTKRTNQVTKTELTIEGGRKLIRGFDGLEKEITDEEYEIYKFADSLNKLPEPEKKEATDKKEK